MVDAFAFGPNRLDRAPEGEQNCAAVKAPLRCVAVVSVLLPVCCFAEAFTIEQVLSAPFPYGLTSASHAPRMAWVFDNKGERNIWVAEAPDFVPRQVTHIAKWRSPVLLIQGDDDRNVPFQQTTDLVEKLRGQNVEFEELIFPDEIHDLLRWSDWIRAYRATAEFFDRRLAADAINQH